MGGFKYPKEGRGKGDRIDGRRRKGLLLRIEGGGIQDSSPALEGGRGAGGLEAHPVT